MTDPQGPTASLERIAEQATALLRGKNAARETALRLSREIIRTSANSIRAAHRGEYERAAQGVQQARTSLEEARRVLTGHADIYHAGFVHDAAKEYAEAAITLALTSGRNIPAPDELALEHEPAAYLNGMGEAVGELRRYVLDLIRQGRIDECEAALGWMDDIYSVLVTVDFPEAVTGGLRRTTDATRGILERTRGDLTVAIAQARLERRLRELGGTLPEPL